MQKLCSRYSTPYHRKLYWKGQLTAFTGQLRFTYEQHMLCQVAIFSHKQDWLVLQYIREDAEGAKSFQALSLLLNLDVWAYVLPKIEWGCSWSGGCNIDTSTINYHGQQTPSCSDQLHKKPAQVLISHQTSQISATANGAQLTHDTSEDQTGACMQRWARTDLS
jgi:hypothetical protein